MLRAPIRWVQQASAGSLLLLAVAIIVCGFGLFYHAGSMPAALSPAEAATRNNSLTLSSIYHNPINAPHNLITFAVHRLGHNHLLTWRFSSAVWALLIILAFYYLARSWFGRTIGLLSSMLLFATPVFILAGRQASAEIMWLSPILIMAAYNWLIRTKTQHNLAWIALMVSAGLLVYTPGLIWWLIGAAVICRHKIIAALATVPRWVVASGLFIMAACLVPAGIAIARDWHLVRSFALVPVHWAAPLLILKNLAWMFVGLIVHTPYHTNLIIGRLPILDVLQIALLVFGVYAMWLAAKTKTLALAAGIVFAVAAAGINDNLNLMLLSLPSAAVFVAAGLRYLYIEWRSVFPVNPLPRTLAIALMAVLIAAQMVFGLTYSLVAWPHTTDTKQTYVLK